MIIRDLKVDYFQISVTMNNPKSVAKQQTLRKISQNANSLRPVFPV